ncbi:hypothetical protein CTEN210_16262 [Chaetoceros tenuissimus]|uniref:WW domain-containing protein n=1 Tax=Chaetoceros tenuissimus TaxID=426638 RepID=A0AAD3D8F1_9STRA|nr:hypothetical protein CTEN210_16262 [Chaetoceros tenuissimus]
MMNDFSKENEASDTNQVLETSSGSLFDRIMKGLNTDEVGLEDESKFDSNEELEKKLEELALDSPLTKLPTSDNLISKSFVDLDLSSEVKEEESIKTVEKVLQVDPQSQWREVKDRNSGKIYYYNRITRETSWTLPKNGVIVGNRRTHRQTVKILPSLSISGITVESDVDEESSEKFGSSFGSVDLLPVGSKILEESFRSTRGENYGTAAGQDIPQADDVLYCLFCGIRSSSTVDLANHLATDCRKCFSNDDSMLALKTGVLKLFQTLTAHHHDNKENIPPENAFHLSRTLENDEEHSSSDESDESTIIDWKLTKQLKTSFTKSRKPRRALQSLR